MPPSYPELLAYGLLQDPGAAPLVIGVTGHRDPTPEAMHLVRRNTRRQLGQLMQELPNTPLLMLNGMAAGIDAEIAEVFLELVEGMRGLASRTTPIPHHQLVATLPKTPATFCEDFDDVTSLQRLHSLLSRADAVLHPGNCQELRSTPLHEGCYTSNTDPTPYAQQGVFLARHSYLLFAYYDGHDTNLMGGTAHVVSIKHEQIYPLFVNVAEVSASREPAALICHATPRLKHPSPEHHLGEIRYWSNDGQQDERLTADVTIPESLMKLPRQLEALNRQVNDTQLTSLVRAEGRYTRLCSALEHEAIELKNRHIRWIKTVVFFGFALVLIAEMLEGLPWFGVAVLVLLASLAWLPPAQEASKERFIEKRSLIECLAVQYLWSAVGVEIDTADLFHVRNDDQLRLPRMILRAVKTQLLAFYSAEKRPLDLAFSKARLWLECQLEFLAMKIQFYRCYNKRCHRAAWVMGGAAAAIGFAQLLPTAPANLYLAGIALLAASATVYTYGELMGFDETANRYQRSLEQFKRGVFALDLLQDGDEEITTTDAVGSWFRHRIVMEAIGREKIDELNDWIADQMQRIYRPGS